MGSKTKYDREQLKLVGGDLLAVLGFIKDKPGYENRPLRILKSDVDDAVYAKVKTATADAIKTEFNKRGFDDLPDRLLAFCFAEGLLKQEAAVEEEDEELAGTISGEEDEDDLVGNDDDAPIIDDPSMGIDDNLSAVLDAVDVPAEPVQSTRRRRGAASASADDKLNALVAEHGEVARVAVQTEMALSPVTVANAEAVVLTIANLLAEGKSVLISALDVTAMSRLGIVTDAPKQVGHATPDAARAAVGQPTVAPTVASGKKPPVGIVMSEQIQKRLTAIDSEEALDSWIAVLFRTKLTADAQRKSFIKKHAVPTSKPVEKLAGRTMATDIKTYLREAWASLQK